MVSFNMWVEQNYKLSSSMIKVKHKICPMQYPKPQPKTCLYDIIPIYKHLCIVNMNTFVIPIYIFAYIAFECEHKPFGK
jgi:hypothetical protein